MKKGGNASCILECLFDGGKHQPPVVMLAHLRGNHLPSEDIFNGGKIPESSLKFEVTHIRAPQFIWPRWTPSMNEIGVGVVISRSGTKILASSSGWLQSKLFHHPLGSFVINTQLPGHSQMTIRWMFFMRLYDQCFQLFIFDSLFVHLVDIFAINSQRWGSNIFQRSRFDQLNFFFPNSWSVSLRPPAF